MVRYLTLPNTFFANTESSPLYSPYYDQTPDQAVLSSSLLARNNQIAYDHTGIYYIFPAFLLYPSPSYRKIVYRIRSY